MRAAQSTPISRWRIEAGRVFAVFKHDRDLNAALNIRSEGMKAIPLAAGCAERINARGAGVRPPHVEAVGAEARIP